MAILQTIKNISVGAKGATPTPKPYATPPVTAPVVPVVGTPTPTPAIATPVAAQPPPAAPQAAVPPPPNIPPATPQPPAGSGNLWHSNPSMKDSVMKHASQHDMLKTIGGQKIADDLYRNAPDNQNAGAGPSSTWAKNAGDEELRLVYDVMDKHTGLNSLKTLLLPWRRKEAIKQRNLLWEQVSKHLHKSYLDELNGMPVTPHGDPRIDEIVDTYRKSGFAKNSLQRQTDSGMDTASIFKSDNYIPLHHDYHKYVSFAKGNAKVLDDIAEAYGKQIIQKFPNLAKNARLTPKHVGRSFMRTQQDSATGASATPFRGTTISEVRDILRNAGVGDAEINQVLNDVSPSMKDAGKLKNHKSRMNLDLSQPYTTSDGRQFTLGDFTKHNLEGQLDAYNNIMSHRIGLAKVGYPDEMSLRTEFDRIAKQYEGNPAKYKEVSDMLEVMFNDVMGRPTGAAMSDLMRSAATVAQSLFLKRSGLFNIVDYHRSVARFGYAKVAVKFLPSFKGTLKSTPMDPSVARRLDEVISGRLINEGRMRSVISMHEDNFAGAVTLGHEYIRAAGQTTKFINVSEYLRRQHINLVTSVQADYLTSFSKATGNLSGEAANAKKYFNDIGIDDTMLAGLKREINQHGLYTDKWTDQVLADKLGTILSSSVDDFAIQVRRGELPPFMAYSSVGKILFPFFTFSAATNQKVLRQTYKADGVTGLAVMMAHQAPLAVIVAASANVMDGKDWDDDVLKRAVGIAPGIGYGAFAFDAFDRGEIGSTPTMWALPNAVANIASGIAEGDVNKVVSNTPMISASPVLQTLNKALSE